MTTSGVSVEFKGEEYGVLTITEGTQGVTFTKSDGTTPGNPDNLETGDIVIYGDYEYRYNSKWDPMTGWGCSEINGWGVRLREDCFEKTTVGELCETIYGEHLISMSYTYVTSIWNDGGVGPDGKVETAGITYIGSSIVTAPVIPSSVEDMSCAFQYCERLKTAPSIPSSVTNMYSTFYSCNSLTGSVQINSSIVEDFEACFDEITITVKVPVNSTTYITITTDDLGSDNVTIETFESEVKE